MTKTTQYPTVALKPPSGFVNDMRLTDNWELIEDVEFTGEETLELAEFLEKGEPSVRGDVMLERSKKNPRASQRHAERLLAQQKDIPKEWRKFYLVFTGTVWRDSGVRLVMACLNWDDGREECFLYWGSLGAYYLSSGRLVRPCK